MSLEQEAKKDKRKRSDWVSPIVFPTANIKLFNLSLGNTGRQVRRSVRPDPKATLDLASSLKMRGGSMNDISRAKGLSELKTASTRHIHASPPRKGENYLDLFALSKEKLRLEQELGAAERRSKRIFHRLTEVQNAMDKLVDEGKQAKADQSSPVESGTDETVAASEQPQERQWKKIPVDY